MMYCGFTIEPATREITFPVWLLGIAMGALWGSLAQLWFQSGLTKAVTFVFAALIAAPTFAGGCGSSRYCAPVYHAPVYQEAAVEKGTYSQTIIEHQNVFY